jgi:hypothetical protein
MGMTSTAGAPTAVLRAVNIDSDLHLSFGHHPERQASLVEGRTATQARRYRGAALEQDAVRREPVNVPDLKDRWEGPETGRKTGELYHTGARRTRGEGTKKEAGSLEPADSPDLKVRPPYARPRPAPSQTAP